jgi:hypothetical protein
LRAAAFSDVEDRNDDRGNRPKRSFGEELAPAIIARSLTVSNATNLYVTVSVPLYHSAARYFRPLRNLKSSRRPAPSASHVKGNQIVTTPMDPPHNGLNTHSEEYQNSLLPAMATSRDAPNPLRPYYIPPSIGLPPDLPQNQTSGPSYSSSLHKPSFGSQARDILSDLDYDSYFADSSPSVTEHARRLLDQALWNYTSVLLAQPFEVAKTILQIHQASGQAPPGLLLNGEELRSRPNSFASGKYEDVSYAFTCNYRAGDANAS